MSAAGSPPRIDFAVVGNASETLSWLRRMLSSVAGVQLVEGEDSLARTNGAQRTGLVAETLPGEQPSIALDAVRLAVVLEDPVRLLARRDQPGQRLGDPGRYAEALAAMLSVRSERPLVLAADELAHSEACAVELFEHLGLPVRIEDALIEDALPLARVRAAPSEPMTLSRRAKLFSTIRDDVEELERLAGRTFYSWRLNAQPVQRRVDPRHLIYLGRRRDAEAPAGGLPLTDWDVLPHRLGPQLDNAATLTLFDPMSFPLDALRERDRAIPTAVRLPRGADADSLIAVLGPPLLDELTPFDAVNAGSDEVWGALQSHYSWPSRMRAEAWELARFSEWAPARELKASYRTLRTSLLAQLWAARRVIPQGEALRGLVLAADVERWSPLSSAAQAELTGIELGPGDAWRAPTSLAGWRLELGMPGAHAEPERFHVAVLAHALCSSTRAERADRISATFHSVRVGGRLIVVDRFLDGRAGRQIDAPSPRELLSEINLASARHVILEHVEALRLPGENHTSVGLFTLTKIGPTARL